MLASVPLAAAEPLAIQYLLICRTEAAMKRAQIQVLTREHQLIDGSIDASEVAYTNKILKEVSRLSTLESVWQG